MKTKVRRNFGEKLLRGISGILFLMGTLAFFSALWYRSLYGDLGFDSILYTLGGETKGVQPELVLDYLVTAALPALLCAGVLWLALLVPWKLQVVLDLGKRCVKLFPVHRWVAFGLSVLLAVGLIFQAADSTGLLYYVTASAKTGSIYEDLYVSPEDVSITFPNEKRNLVYIFLESMETTFLSKELGGGVENNLIPELYQLTEENISFSHTEGPGGFFNPTGTTWTAGALIAATSGIHLQLPKGVDNNKYADYFEEFLPGAVGLTDILHENGYRQMAMFGSDASFGGRREFFTQHGVDEIFDLYTARDRGLVSKNYFKWWGFEDKKLFEFAKTELTQLAEGEEPFAFYMLTADTHFPNGYVCEDCGSDYGQQYENVIACSSRRVYEFVRWLQEQPFYENTTIVITGDHATMDNTYISGNVEADYVRSQYNCFINAVSTPEDTHNRASTVFDMYPTTLAAMGCTVEGDRLGLGTNLFSQCRTVLEICGSREILSRHLANNSVYYTEVFTSGDKMLPE